MTTPQVTMQDIEDAIASEHYFTARDGAEGACGGGSTYPVELGLGFSPGRVPGAFLPASCARAPLCAVPCYGARKSDALRGLGVIRCAADSTLFRTREEWYE